MESASPRDERDVLMGELVQMIADLNLLFRTALLCTSVEAAKQGMVYVRKADALIAKAQGRS